MNCKPTCVRPRAFQTIQHCGVCHQTFSSSSSGDMHRVPKRFRITEDGRRVREGHENRCLNEREMMALGMNYDPDRRIWRGPRGSEEPENWGA